MKDRVHGGLHSTDSSRALVIIQNFEREHLIIVAQKRKPNRKEMTRTLLAEGNVIVLIFPELDPCRQQQWHQADYNLKRKQNRRRRNLRESI